MKSSRRPITGSIWNARDVESVLGHFEESARFTSPKALATTGCAIVEGRAALRAYWRARLRQIRSLRFTLDRVLWDAEQRTATILYVAKIDDQRVRACEMFRLGEGGRAVEGEAMYGAPV
jgi:SnoaL-like domain